MFQMLHTSGFDDWICMEEASFKGKAGVKAAADFVRRIWSETAVR
jgi:hypothetical protein